MEQFVNQIEQNRYEMEVDGEIAYADYRLAGDTIYINHVFAPPALRGTGVASRLMVAVMEDINQHGYKAVPICSYAAA